MMEDTNTSSLHVRQYIYDTVKYFKLHIYACNYYAIHTINTKLQNVYYLRLYKTAFPRLLHCD